MARRVLSLLPRAVSQRTGMPGPNHRRVWGAAVSGEIPAELIGNRWTWLESDLDEIVRGLGMVPAQSGNAGEDASVRASCTAVEHASV